MKRPEITKQLSELLEKHIDPHNDPRVYWAKEVTFDYATSNTVRVDYRSNVLIEVYELGNAARLL